MPRTLTLLSLLFALDPLTAQDWTLRGTAPRVDFGLTHELLASDAQGLVGFDEFTAQTIVPVLPFGGAWQGLATAVAPLPRLASLLVGGGSRVYLFGGQDAGTGQLQNDLWFLDRAVASWQSLPTLAGGGPGPRREAKAAVFAAGSWLVLFGGRDASGYCLDTWTMLQVGGAALWGTSPTPAALVGRIGHTLCAAPGGTAVLFGGMATAPLGDTWVFGTNGWQAHTGPGPAAATGCRSTYDSGRDVTVLLHPNGETWEWNGFDWRLVGAVGAPPWSQPALVYDPTVAVAFAVQSGTGTSTWAYTPSPAAYDTTLDTVCTMAPPGPPSVTQFARSLPVLGQTMRMRVSGLPANSLAFGGFELPGPGGRSAVAIGCGCLFGLSGAGVATQFLPRTGPFADWHLPIANLPVLWGQSIDAQGLVLDPAGACLLLTTERALLTIGR